MDIGTLKNQVIHVWNDTLIATIRSFSSAPHILTCFPGSFSRNCLLYPWTMVSPSHSPAPVKKTPVQVGVSACHPPVLSGSSLDPSARPQSSSSWLGAALEALCHSREACARPSAGLCSCSSRTDCYCCQKAPTTGCRPTDGPGHRAVVPTRTRRSAG